MLKDYYRKDLKKLYKFLTPKGSKVLILSDVRQLESQKKNFDYIIVDDILGDINDIQDFFIKINHHCKPTTKVIITYYNQLWEPALKMASKLGIRRNTGQQNWLSSKDFRNILSLSDFEIIYNRKKMLIPLHIPLLSDFANRWLATLPFLNSICLTTYLVARPKPKSINEYSVSIIVPARNEEGNIPKIAASIPKFGKSQEIIFVEGNSTDKTWQAIVDFQNKYDGKTTIKVFKQKGKGKADAVWLGFKKANGEILIIYDADRTVDAKDLLKFYSAISLGLGEFINGNRLVYPMENQAMQSLNKVGNHIFGSLFTWILGQDFKDTLCGTKALFKTDYLYMRRHNKKYFQMDPFGDFALIFGAIKNNLKVVEIPVRYKERVYGSTNINRFKHGLMLFKMTAAAFAEFTNR